MSEPWRKTYRPWEPQRYRQEAHSPDTKLPEGDIVFFLLDTVSQLDLRRFYASYEDETRGAPPFDPAMMVCLLLYAYCVGVFSSRKIAQACERNLAFLAIVGQERPDFRTISDFRKLHLEAFRSRRRRGTARDIRRRPSRTGRGSTRSRAGTRYTRRRSRTSRTRPSSSTGGRPRRRRFGASRSTPAARRSTSFGSGAAAPPCADLRSHLAADRRVQREDVRRERTRAPETRSVPTRLDAHRDLTGVAAREIVVCRTATSNAMSRARVAAPTTSTGPSWS